MASYQALYYPFMHFKDEGWLKACALYWDKIGRVVPHTYQTQDSPTVVALGNMIETLRPDWVRPEFGEAFAQFIDQYRQPLQDRYSVALRDDTWLALANQQKPPTAGGYSGRDPRLAYVYYEKISESLLQLLNESGIGEPDGADSRWIGMHPRLGAVYMTAMAEQLAGERGLRPLTDESFDHLAISGCSIERLAQALLGDVKLVDAKPTATEIESTIVSVAFQTVVPKNVASLPVDKILAFREKYPNERAAFQKAVADFIKPREWLNSIHEPKVLEARLKDEFDKEWKPKLDELDEKLREIGIDTMLGTFNYKTTLPTGITGAAVALALPLNPLAAGIAGLALGAIPALRDKRKSAHDALRSSPVTFLYRLEKELTPLDLWGWIKQRSQQFAFGI